MRIASIAGVTMSGLFVLNRTPAELPDLIGEPSVADGVNGENKLLKLCDEVRNSLVSGQR